ncbi:MAG: hypothetical protein WC428_02505 [Candidatus Paceibacterota bacterium]|jgi:hypothetical protein
MAYEKNIEIYKIKGNFNVPLASNPNQIAESGANGFLIIIDDDVFVQDWNAQRTEQFAKANFNATFVKLNPAIFDKQ